MGLDMHLYARKYFSLPAARDLTREMLRQAEDRAERSERNRMAGWCSSGCSEPVATEEPELLCAKCAKEMQS